MVQKSSLEGLNRFAAPPFACSCAAAVFVGRLAPIRDFLQRWATEQVELVDGGHEASLELMQKMVSLIGCVQWRSCAAPLLGALCVVAGISCACSDTCVCVGKATAAPFFSKAVDWLKKLLDREDKAEREEWGDDVLDDDGRPKETMAAYARKNLA